MIWLIDNWPIMVWVVLSFGLGFFFVDHLNTRGMNYGPTDELVAGVSGMMGGFILGTLIFFGIVYLYNLILI